MMKQKIKVLTESLKSKKGTTTPMEIARLVKDLPDINEAEIGLRL